MIFRSEEVRMRFHAQPTAVQYLIAQTEQASAKAGLHLRIDDVSPSEIRLSILTEYDLSAPTRTNIPTHE